jgi:hypothetical protein
MPVPGTRNDENGMMMVARRCGVLVISAPVQGDPASAGEELIVCLLAPNFRSSGAVA